MFLKALWTEIICKLSLKNSYQVMNKQAPYGDHVQTMLLNITNRLLLRNFISVLLVMALQVKAWE